jgi:nicotinamide riboside kinase
MFAPDSPVHHSASSSGVQKTGLVVALVGAESTGKSTLATALAREISALTAWRCAAVPEVLREWCDLQGRTPLQHEQQAIALSQAQRVEQAAMQNEVVLADTTPLMTAVYHHHVFASDELDTYAMDWQRRHCDITLLMALDLPWQADGMQRDGPHVRPPVDNRIRALLSQADLPFTVITGQGDQRLARAMDALAPLLLARQPPGSGLFTRLHERQALQARWQWHCTECDDPECEHRLQQLAEKPESSTPSSR